MKKAIVFIVLMMCSCATAGEINSSEHQKTATTSKHPAQKNKLLDCAIRGEIFSRAAMLRDEGVTPQETLHFTEGYAKSKELQISIAYIKNAINLVYFDPRFTNAGGPNLANQIREDCMRNGKPEFEPLK